MTITNKLRINLDKLYVKVIFFSFAWSIYKRVTVVFVSMFENGSVQEIIERSYKFGVVVELSNMC